MFRHGAECPQADREHHQSRGVHSYHCGAAGGGQRKLPWRLARKTTEGWRGAAPEGKTRTKAEFATLRTVTANAAGCGGFCRAAVSFLVRLMLTMRPPRSFTRSALEFGGERVACPQQSNIGADCNEQIPHVETTLTIGLADEYARRFAGFANAFRGLFHYFPDFGMLPVAEVTHVGG